MYMCITFRFYFSRLLTHSLKCLSHRRRRRRSRSLCVCYVLELDSSLTDRQTYTHTNTQACAQWKTVCQQTSIDSGQKHPLEVWTEEKNEQFRFSLVVNIFLRVFFNHFTINLLEFSLKLNIFQTIYLFSEKSFDAILCNTRCLLCVYIPISWIHIESGAPSGCRRLVMTHLKRWISKRNNHSNENKCGNFAKKKIILFIFQFKHIDLLEFKQFLFSNIFQHIFWMKTCAKQWKSFQFQFEILEVVCCAFETFWILMKRYVLIFVRVH